MSPADRQRMEQLERELRDARTAYDDLAVSPDAWQQNQRRLAATRSRRGGRALRIAAVLVAVVLAGALVTSLADDGPRRGAPASIGDDAFDPSAVLGPTVELERRVVDGRTVVHEAVLSDLTGEGPMLCDREMAVSSGSEGCASRDPEADDAGVALDWLTGSQVDGAHGLVAGVDGRVLKVQVWMDNGDMTLADLKPSGWEGTKLFGLSVPGNGPVPQRLVAYADASGDVLESVDLVARFGSEWLPGSARAGCPKDGEQVLLRNRMLVVSATPSRAALSDIGTGSVTRDRGPWCTGLDAPLQGFETARKELVLLLGPEVDGVSVPGKAPSSVQSGSPRWIEGTIWRVQQLYLEDPLGPDDEIVATDTAGDEIGPLPVSSLVPYGKSASATSP